MHRSFGVECEYVWIMWLKFKRHTGYRTMAHLLYILMCVLMGRECGEDVDICYRFMLWWWEDGEILQMCWYLNVNFCVSYFTVCICRASLLTSAGAKRKCKMLLWIAEEAGGICFGFLSLTLSEWDYPRYFSFLCVSKSFTFTGVPVGSWTRLQSSVW